MKEIINFTKLSERSACKNYEENDFIKNIALREQNKERKKFSLF